MPPIPFADMDLPLSPPVPPQLARSRETLPEGEGWSYEPKWDGFRTIAFVDGPETYLQSRNGRPMGRYFPEVTFPPGRFVLDGELVILGPRGRQEFDALQMRLHPAASRVRKLAEERPATFVAFDLLALDDQSLLDRPFEERRAALEKVQGELALTPCTRERKDARRWLRGAEGVVAKEIAAPYKPGERTGMVKVKRIRTLDCVVMGYRPGKADGTVGSLILGLYDDAGELHVVGHTSGFSAKEKRELVSLLGPYESGERGSGEPSRWTAGRDLEWIELRPELVAEVSFDHVSARRIRHGAAFLRWRDDKDPRTCTIDELK
jgi:ATP-dependent DNA ligase